MGIQHHNGNSVTRKPVPIIGVCMAKAWEHQLAENAAEITFENLQSHGQTEAGQKKSRVGVTWPEHSFSSVPEVAPG